MSEISGLYSSGRTVYRKTGKRSSKNLHGDIKHIIYKDGEPLMCEVIKVSKKKDEREKRQSANGSKPRRIKATTRNRKSSEEVLKRKKEKLSERLKKAIQMSQTLWNEKEGIYISYQGSHGFLVKLYNDNKDEIRNEIMTQTEIIDSSIPGLLEAGWKIV